MSKDMLRARVHHFTLDLLGIYKHEVNTDMEESILAEVISHLEDTWVPSPELTEAVQWEIPLKEMS